MASVRAILGVEKVLKNIKRRSDEMELNVSVALKRAGLKLQRASQGLVPVDLGNLKASAFTRAEGSGFKTQVRVGYTAFYALYVHEAVAMKLKGLPRGKGRGFFWDPQGKAQAKFLEEPARTLRPELRRNIREATKIK